MDERFDFTERVFSVEMPSPDPKNLGWVDYCGAKTRIQAARIFARRLDDKSNGEAGYTWEDLVAFVQPEEDYEGEISEAGGAWVQQEYKRLIKTIMD